MQSSAIHTWKEMKEFALTKCKEYGDEYQKRLRFEITEIEKQGAGDYWVKIIENGKTYETNKNGLVLPFMLGITTADPIIAKVPHIVEYQNDFPDVDVDLLPGVRELVEKYASDQYGADKVCAVGLWQTYKPKSALQDAAKALNKGPEKIAEIMKLTKGLPEDFDKLMDEDNAERTNEQALKVAIEDYPDFRAFAEREENRDIVNMAFRMIHLVKTQGRHAGGLIVANKPVGEHIPLTLCSGRLTTAWTEGHNSQLSKFGFVKFDMLGVRTLLYIRTCMDLIRASKGIRIEWTDIDPTQDRAGWMIDDKDESRSQIRFTDEQAIEMANSLRVETIFQFETEFAKQILHKGGVKSFNDLVVYTSLGRPGPLPMIDTYIARRDGKESWEKDENPIIIEKLKSTFGVIVFQEQLAAIWQSIGGFTVPESEKARKAVAKKVIEDFKPFEKKWLAGATRVLGEAKAKEWWERMATFGRYAFNKAHPTAYMVVAHRCLWLKAHFPTEWWAAVMSDCDNERLGRYMSYARADGVKFGLLDVDKLTKKFSINSGLVTPGITSVKGVGSTADDIIAKNETYTDIDDFVTKNGKSKTICEPLIKLGAFDKKHPSRRGTWIWYQYQYGTDEESKKTTKLVQCAFGWPKNEITKERERQLAEYFVQYPNRKTIPAKLKNWLPKTPYKRANYEMAESINGITEEQYLLAKSIVVTRDQVMALAKYEFPLKDILLFEKEYLGYHFHSPLDMYVHKKGELTIAKATKDEGGIIEAVIEKCTKRKKQTEFAEVVVTDGQETTKVMIWSDELSNNGDEVLKEGVGVRMRVTWKEKFNSFNLKKGSIIIPLEKVDATE
jgi:DNA polymerase III alpha subunit